MAACYIDQAEVLDGMDDVIPWLCACGLDMEEPFPGRLFGPICYLGPAMKFGFIAATDIARHAQNG
jgi:hypothetical protein